MLLLILQGALVLLGLALLGITAGFGFLSLLGAPRPLRERLCFAPMAATALWVLPASVVLRFGWPLSRLAPGLAALTLGLAVIGAWALCRAWRRGSRPARARTVALVAGLATMVGWLIWPALNAGLTAHLGSAHPDTRYYTSLAAYYWSHGRNLPADLAPFFAEQVQRRFLRSESGASILLAAFSPLVEPGEPMFVRNVFVGWTLLVLVWSLAGFRLTWHRTSGGAGPVVGATLDSLLYVVACAGLGWAVVPALAASWDNALLVGVGPVLAALLLEPRPGPAHGLLFGTVTAFGVVAYTEFTPLLALVLAPVVVARLVDAHGRGALLRAGGIAVAATAAWLVWSARALVDYLVIQRGHAQARVGGAFASGLVETPWHLGGFWALGPEQGLQISPWVEWPVALSLTSLLALGLVRLCRRAEGASLLLALAVTAVTLFGFRYSYAGYKVLNVTWWLVGLGLVEGLATVRRAWPRWPWARRLALAGIGGLGLAGVLHTSQVRHDRFLAPPNAYWLPSVATLVRLREAARAGLAQRIVVDAHALAAMPWVRYVLRDTHVDAANLTPESAEEGAAALMVLSTAEGRAAYPEASVTLEAPDLVLLRTTAPLLLARIENPNSLEQWGSWVGTHPMTLGVWAAASTPARLLLEAAPGPSVPETSRRTLQLSRGAAVLAVVPFDGPASLCLPFTAPRGWTSLTLAALDQPTRAVMPNGDTRPLVVGVRRLTLVSGERCR